MATSTFTPQVVTSGITVTPAPRVYSGSGIIGVQDAIAGSSTTQINVAIDVSAVKQIVIHSTVAATLKTNSSGSPANTIVLKADVEYVWNTDSYDSFLLTTDVTTVFLVVAGATAGVLTISGVQDATP